MSAESLRTDSEDPQPDAQAIAQLVNKSLQRLFPDAVVEAGDEPNETVFRLDRPAD